jgi:tetratricopeptide (TPR) repeat protein
MMNKYFLMTLWVILFFLLTGFTSDPNGKANALYVNAVKLMKSLKTETVSYTRVFDRYQSARAKIDSITADYASSNIAVRLVSEQIKIASFRLSEFERLAGDLQPFVKAEQEPLACALYVAGAINEAYEKSLALSEIAGQYADARQLKGEALQLLSQAHVVAQAIRDPFDKANALATIAEQYAVVGDLAKALKTVGKIGPHPMEHNVGYYRARAMAVIADRFGSTDQLAQIRRTVDTKREDGSYINEILIKIAGRFAEIGRISEANEAAQAISAGDYIDQNKALLAIAVMQAQPGQFSNAIEAANNINHYDNAWLLADTSGKYAQAGQNEEAIQLLALALEAAGYLDHDPSYKAIVFAFIAGKYAEAGQQQKATQLFTRALMLAKTIDYAEEKARVLARIAAIFAETRHEKKAAMVLSQALESLKSAKDSGFKGEVLTSIANIYARIGQFSEAIKAADAIEVADYKDQAVAAIADNYAGAGRFNKALELVETIKGKGNKARVLAKIAGKYASAGQQPGNREKVIFQKIVQTTKPMKLPWE